MLLGAGGCRGFAVSVDPSLHRDRLILWPVYTTERDRSTGEREVTALASAFGWHREPARARSSLRLVPAFWYRSARAGQDLRLASTWYPSLLRLVREEAGARAAVVEIYDHVALGEVARWSGYTSSHLFPVWWQRSRPGFWSAHLWPLYGRSVAEGGLDEHHVAWPFFGVGRQASEGRGWFRAAWPLAGARWGPGWRRAWAFPLVWHARRPDGSGHTVVGPLARWGRRGAEEHTLFFPLHYQRRCHGSGGRLGGAPPSWDTFSAAGLYGAHGDARGGWRYVAPLAAASWREGSEGAAVRKFWSLPYTRLERPGSVRHALLAGLARLRLRTIRPGDSGPAFRADLLGGVARWQEGPRGQHLHLLPLALSRHDGPRETDVVLPVFFRYRDRDAAVSLWHLWPLYGRTEWATRRTRSWAWPLFSVTDDRADASYRSVHVLRPLAHSFRQGRTRLSYVFPIWWDRHRPGSREQVLFPLWFRFEDRHAGRGTRYLFPLGLYRREGPVRRLSPLWPLSGLAWQPGRGDWHEAWLLAGLARDERHGERRRSWVLPFFYRRSAPREGRTIAFPLWASARDASRGRAFRWLVPLYLGQERGTSRRDHLLWPLGLSVHRRGADPSYYRVRLLGALAEATGSRGGRHRSHVFPLWWSERTRGYGSHLFLPIFSWSRAAHHDRRAWTLWPVLGRSVSATSSAWSLAPPLVRWKRRAGPSGAWRLDLAGPLAGLAQSGERSSHRLLPVAWYHGTPRRGQAAFLPLYWREWRDPDRPGGSERLMVFPWYRGQRPFGWHRWGVFPLVEREEGPGHQRWWYLGWLGRASRSGDRLHHRLFPLYSWASAGARGRFSALPLVWLRWGKGRHDLWLAGPLLHDRLRGEGRRRTELLWHLAERRSRHGGAVEWRVLYRLFRHRSGGGSLEQELMPLYEVERGTSGDLYLAVGKVLFSYERTGAERSVRLLHFLRFAWQG
ncbi:MAG: hypothetical protein HY722_05130 [Planctomycetes bacterium]|nr:hypothetical protein [Planctomycetota bacterium]